MKKKNCTFCNYKDKEVIVYQDKLCYVIISRDPINKHHVLVIPKQHYENFVKLPDKLASHIFLVAKRLSAAVRKASKAYAITHISDDDISKSGINLVKHYKFHIIPRFKKDISKMERDWIDFRVHNLGIQELSKFAKEIKRHLKK